ncbi:hypothetical protein MPNT_50088 [Candidatus Methylacidithermus pantelleriae]|uniref:Uncharacterized protein n=1 Tax=Candidatus Methylacidithermus pantelleriae TaxID=2744239 RepID=A0A8J2BLB8_9BACT|nr:hypothetical protein MPNT_50088 [Candidatus Methylacidithermus pantelleriae]
MAQVHAIKYPKGQAADVGVRREFFQFVPWHEDLPAAEPGDFREGENMLEQLGWAIESLQRFPRDCLIESKIARAQTC